MDNLTPTARAYKRRKLDSSRNGHDSEAGVSRSSQASPGSGFIGFVGRMFRGSGGDVREGDGKHTVEEQEQEREREQEAGESDKTLPDCVVQNGDMESVQEERQGREAVKGEDTTPGRKKRGRPPKKREPGNMAPLSQDGIADPARADGVNVARRSSRKSIPRLPDPFTDRTNVTSHSTPRRQATRPKLLNGENHKMAEETVSAAKSGDLQATGTEMKIGPTADQMDIDSEQELSEPQPRSSGRPRRRPRRYSIDMEEPREENGRRKDATELVGILTPSKRRKAGQRRGRKSVAFESDESNRQSLEDTLTTGGADEQESTGQEQELDLEGQTELLLQQAIVKADGVAGSEDVAEIVAEIPEYVRFFRMACEDGDVEEKVPLLSRIIVEQLTGKRRIRLLGLDDAFAKVHQVIQQTVMAGEGNSMLVLGGRGCGKTTLVETAVSDLARDHRDEFHVIRLNGFIHTDDRVALKEIWRQLGREMELEDEFSGNPLSYADTLSSLLALLSHPEEMSGEETDATAKAVIFIMDEFDLFTLHPRQTLLYNLFDIAQSRKAPVAVLGLSTKIDVAQSLEKRVKSRFSHRYVHLPMPKNSNVFIAICKAGLEVCSTAISDLNCPPLVEAWSEYIKGLFEQDEVFNSFIHRTFYQTKSVQTFFNACVVPILHLSPDTLPQGKDFDENSVLPPDSKLQLLDGLSSLELSLLIAAARLNVILDQDNCNFNMVFEQYQDMVSKAKIRSLASGAAATGAGSKMWSRPLSLGAWESLGEYELIMPATGVGGVCVVGGRGDVSREGRMFKADVALEEIVPSVRDLNAVMIKWCKEI